MWSRRLCIFAGCIISCHWSCKSSVRCPVQSFDRKQWPKPNEVEASFDGRRSMSSLAVAHSVSAVACKVSTLAILNIVPRNQTTSYGYEFRGLKTKFQGSTAALPLHPWLIKHEPVKSPFTCRATPMTWCKGNYITQAESSRSLFRKNRIINQV